MVLTFPFNDISCLREYLRDSFSLLWLSFRQVFVQSDVVEVALDMKNQLDEVDALSHIDALNSDILCDSEGWLLSNPMGIRTEREIHAEFEGAKIYRRLYEKKQM